MKEFKKTSTTQEKEGIEREINILQMLKHDNIVHFIEAFWENNTPHLIMEFCE